MRSSRDSIVLARRGATKAAAPLCVKSVGRLGSTDDRRAGDMSMTMLNNTRAAAGPFRKTQDRDSLSDRCHAHSCHIGNSVRKNSHAQDTRHRAYRRWEHVNKPRTEEWIGFVT